MSSDPNPPGPAPSSPIAGDRPLVWPPPHRPTTAEVAPPSPENRGDRETAILREDLHSLRNMFQVTVAALILVLGVLNIVLFHQVRLIRRQAFEVQTSVNEMTRIVGDYATNSVPLMNNFVTELRRFAEKNADFAAVMSKYSVNSNAPAQGPRPPAPPGPASVNPR